MSRDGTRPTELWLVAIDVTLASSNSDKKRRRWRPKKKVSDQEVVLLNLKYEHHVIMGVTWGVGRPHPHSKWCMWRRHYTRNGADLSLHQPLLKWIGINLMRDLVRVGWSANDKLMNGRVEGWLFEKSMGTQSRILHFCFHFATLNLYVDERKMWNSRHRDRFCTCLLMFLLLYFYWHHIWTASTLHDTGGGGD